MQRKFTTIGLFLLLLGLATAARPAEDPPSGDASATTSTTQPAANLATAKSIFIEPMGEGFDKFLSSELSHTKDLYTVTDKDHADLWMKGVVTVIPVGDDASSSQPSDLAHSKQPVKGMATVVVLPRDGKEVLWQGDARLFSVPGNRIPTMAKTIVSDFRKAVKDSRKSGQ